MRAILVSESGGPEVLRYAEVSDPAPGRGEVLVRVGAAGVNFMDVYQREGRYRVDLPAVLGSEAAGEVVAVGEGVSAPSVGDRVAYTGVLGAYAELQSVPAERAVGVPDGMPLEQAAAAMLQGMTAHYLCHDAFALRAGQACLVHAAAGGTGLLLVQMAKQRGARVFGTVSSDAKAKRAREAGADQVIRYDRDDFVQAIEEATGGEGVDVVYDGVGRDTFVRGLDVLKPRGTMVLFGAASGPVEPFDLGLLASKGSLFVTRPSLPHYVASREELERRAAAVLGAVASGELALRIDAELPLERAQEAHRRLEGRASSGKLLLVP